MNEEGRFQHTYVQINTGAQRRSKSDSTDVFQQRINTLNKRYDNKEIDVEELLSSLSLLVTKKK